MNSCKKWESNPWICWWCELKQTTGLKFSIESVTKDVNLTYPIVWAWESNPGPTQVWNRKPIQGVQGDSNTWLCFKVGLSNINVRIWKSNPWLLCCETKYWSKKLFLIFYTLVMGFVHYGAVIIAYYEAVHCLFGHHKFCWSSLHRCMRSV
jgi:hypothetical protein